MHHDDYRRGDAVSESMAAIWSSRLGAASLGSAVGDAHSLSLRRALARIFDASTLPSPDQRYPVYRAEPFLPVDVSSPRVGVEPLAFGDGAGYGEQGAGSVLEEGDVPLWGSGGHEAWLYWSDLPRGVVSVGSTMMPGPSMSGPGLIKDRDWFLSRNGKSVGFVADPSGFGTLWCPSCRVDHEDILSDFGFVPGLRSSDPEESANFAMAAMLLATSGPTRNAIEAFVSAAAGHQICQERGEVGSISVDESGRTIVVVGESFVSLPPGVGTLDRVVVGAVVERGAAVSSVAKALSPPSDPGWWSRMSRVSVPNPWSSGSSLHFFSYPSTSWPPEPVCDDDSRKSFLSSLDWGAPPAGMVVPAEFAAESMLGPAAIPVVVDLSLVADTGLMFSRLAILQRMVPSSATLVLSCIFPVDEGNAGLSCAEGEDRVSGYGAGMASLLCGGASESGTWVRSSFTKHRRF